MAAAAPLTKEKPGAIKAAAAPVSASSFGTSASVASLINVAATPTATFPAKTSDTTANVNGGTLFNTGAVSVTANGDTAAGTSSASAEVDNLNLGLAGIQAVGANVIKSTCAADDNAPTGTTTVTGLNLTGAAGATVPTNPTPNTVVNIAGLGTLTFNEQTTGTSGSQKTLAVNALHVRLTGGTVGDVIFGHSECGSVSAPAAVAPTITSVVPNSGPLAGGGIVTITGTNLSTVTSVTIGGNAAPILTKVAGTITATVPAGNAAGATNLVITSPGGTATSTYTYLDVPSLLVTPAQGPTTGGTTVTITGLSVLTLVPSDILFDNTPGTNLQVNGLNLTVTSPPHAAGPVQVKVRALNGTLNVTLGLGQFTYVPVVPVIDSLSPDSGPTGGGQKVIIKGHGFIEPLDVTFGGDPAIDVNVVDDTEIDIVTPGHDAGPVDVIVDTDGGPSVTERYIYVAAPVITSLDPVVGPTDGGTDVTLDGRGFDIDTVVTFDGLPGTDPVLSDPDPAVDNSYEKIKVTTPPHDGGPVTVKVRNAGGPKTSTEKYVYIPPLDPSIDIDIDITVSGKKTVTPEGPDYIGLKVTSCETPDVGTVTESADGTACIYNAPDAAGTDTFKINAMDLLGQDTVQTVHVNVVSGADTGGGGGNDTGGGGGNDTGNGGGNSTGSSGGNDTGGTLAFTGTPALLLYGLFAGILLLLTGAGLIGGDELRRRAAAVGIGSGNGYDDGSGLALMGMGEPDPQESENFGSTPKPDGDAA